MQVSPDIADDVGIRTPIDGHPVKFTGSKPFASDENNATQFAMAEDNIDLAEVLAMLLPPGLVSEDPTAYAKLAVLPSVPWEDIHKLWNSMGALRYSFAVDALAILTPAARFYFQIQEVSRPDLVSSGALLVACVGK